LSLLGALTPLGQGTRTWPVYRGTYIWALIAHTAGSVISGALAGAGLGWLGAYLVSGRLGPTTWLSLGGLSLLLGFREFGWIQFPVPQWPRQTKKVWGLHFGRAVAAWFWGLDLGSGLTTLVTFSGYWILVLVALLGGEVVYGTLVLGLYGLGRGLSVAIVPLLLDHTLGLLAALQRVRGFGPSLHRWHGYGLLALAIGLTIRGLLF